MRVLVTGLEGFTGQYIKNELLKHGHIVEGLSSNLMDADGLLAEVKLKQPDAVVHLAAIAFVEHGYAADFYKVNVIGTRNLLQALLPCASKLQAILLASSANVYGNYSEGILSESAVTNPANDYAVSKLSMEYMAKLWSDKLPLFIVRPFNYTGVGQSQDFLIPKIVQHFKSKSPYIELGNLDVARDFSDVRSIASIYLKLLEAKPLGNVINVCTGKTYSLRDVLAIAENITHHKIEVRVNPALIRTNEVRILCGDASRLTSIIGCFQSPSLAETLNWMLLGDA